MKKTDLEGFCPECGNTNSGLPGDKCPNCGGTIISLEVEGSKNNEANNPESEPQVYPLKALDEDITGNKIDEDIDLIKND